MIDPASPVSVLIPAHDSRRWIEETLGSVAAQTRLPGEIIVVDDGSTDGTPEVVAAFSPDITVIRQDNHGIAQTRNRLLAAASREFISFLDHDDLYPADRIELLLAEFDRPPGADIVSGRVEVFGEQMTGRPETAPGSGNTVHAMSFGSTLIRRAVFGTTGPLNESVGAAEDVEWFMRARDLGCLVRYVDVLTLRYRWHETNTSHDIDRAMGHIVDALQQSIGRRRRGDAG